MGLGLGLRGYALAALLLWVLLGALREQWERRRHARALRARCATMALADSVLVLVRARRDPEVGWTLFSLFDRAYCPFRVYVGVMEDEDTDSLELLEGVRAHNRALLDHVRTAKHDFSTRWEPAGLDAHHRSEPYVLCMTSDTMVEPHWDAQLLAHATEDSAWSAVPPHTPYRYPHLHRGRAEACSRKAGAAPEAAAPEAAAPGHFVCLTGLAGPWRDPALALRPCVLAQPAPTLLWTSRLGFCRADALRRALVRVPSGHISDGVDDCLLTGALLLEGLRLRLPPRVVGTTLVPPGAAAAAARSSSSPGAFRPAAQHLELARAFRRHTNVDLERPFVGQRARLGLGPDPANNEIMIKYGSRTRYQRAHARLRRRRQPPAKNIVGSTTTTDA